MNDEELLIELGDKLLRSERQRLIAKIKLDAMKEGMRRAANKIRREIESCGCNGTDRNGCESCNAKENSRIDILTAAEQLTEKDL